MDLVTDTRLHTGEPHCCTSVASQSPHDSFRVLERSVSIQIHLEQFIFAIASRQVPFLLMWSRVISDNEVNKCSEVHQLHKLNLRVWLRISIFHHLLLQGRMVKKETFYLLANTFQFSLHYFKIHFLHTQ